MWTPEQVKKIVSEHQIVIFAKGTKEQPMCGFSHRAIEIMNRIGKPFEVINIFDDPDIRPSLIEASGWPTTPQVFVSGEMIGGSDIVLELFESGELAKKVDAAFASKA